MISDSLVSRPPADVITPASMGLGALETMRQRLGQVRPRDPQTRQLGERRWRIEILAELCDGETFTAIMGWLSSSDISSDETRINYADDMRQWAHVMRQLGRDRFSFRDVTPGVIRSWKLAQETQVRPDGKRKVSDRTILRRLSALSSLIDYTAWSTMDPELRRSNPVSRYDRPKIDRHDTSTATPILEVDEYRALVKAAATPREQFVPMLIYTVAGRVTECCKATTSKLTYPGGVCTLDLRRKGGKGREFPLSAELAQLLPLVHQGRANAPLMPDEDGNPMDRIQVAALITRLAKEAGVGGSREVTPHWLRASRLTHMHDAGVPVEEIQQFADHEVIETTLGYIRHRDDAAMRARHVHATGGIHAGLNDRWTTTP